MAETPTPLITIITVVYNAVAHLEDTIDSVANMTYGNLEYIIVDGGSTDGTVDIIKKHSAVVKKWISEKDKGIYDAFNKGWKLADDTSYVLYLGAGDKIFGLPRPELLFNKKAVYGVVQLGDHRMFRSTAGFRLRLGNTLHHQALLVKKDVHPEPPFDLTFRTYADFDFNQRLIKKGVDFTFVEGFRAYALPGGVSENFNEMESAAIVKKNFGLFWGLVARAYYAAQHLKRRILN